MITITAENFEELRSIAKEILGRTAKENAPAPVAEETPKKEAPVKEAPAPEAPKETPAVDIQTVRQALARLNRKTGENRARDLIGEVAKVSKLTDAPAEALPELLRRAEEELNA